MDISLNWIKEFVDLDNNLTPDDIANRFTLACAEVEEVKLVGQTLSQIKVAEITEIEKHPEADKLNLVSFKFMSDGQELLKRVVCGAPNVKVGLRVPYAPLGAVLPGNFVLTPKKIRGILSEGMLCSSTELGLGKDSQGLLELPSDVDLSVNLSEYYNQKPDAIIEVDNKSLTHRPDLWGHYGLAREFAVIFDKELKNPFNPSWQKEIESHFTSDNNPISLEKVGESSLKAYWGITIDNVTVGESPQWLVEKLENVGLRSISNLVDISNYLMLELGLPNHFFDADKIRGSALRVGTLADLGIENTNFTTLDEIERKLLPTDTVIADEDGPQVLAGIMGGARSSVDNNTKRVFVEVANWDAAQTRLISTRLGLRTDSSQRFEKSLDSHLCYRSLLRAIELIKRVCPDAKVVGKPSYIGEELRGTKLTLSTSVERINSRLGTDLDEAKIVQLFEGLDFDVKSTKGELEVQIPTYRITKDIENEADLVEEIGRLIGFDNIPVVAPKTSVVAGGLSYAHKLKRKIQDFLVMRGQALEILTYPMVGEKLLKDTEWPDLNEQLTLVNSLSKEADRMRPSLIPQMLEVLSKNSKNFDQYRFFETGRSYLADAKSFSKEQEQLVVCFYHKSESPILELLNVVEGLFELLPTPVTLVDYNQKFESPLVKSDWAGIHPFEKKLVKVMGKSAGVIFSLHPYLLRKHKIKGNASLLVLNLDPILGREIKASNKYTPLGKYPMSNFDCTVLVKRSDVLSAPLDCMTKYKDRLLKSAKIVTYFELDNDHYAVTLRTHFGDEEKTISGEDLKNSQDKLIAHLEKSGFPLKV